MDGFQNAYVNHSMARNDNRRYSANMAARVARQNVNIATILNFSGNYEKAYHNKEAKVCMHHNMDQGHLHTEIRNMTLPNLID